MAFHPTITQQLLEVHSIKNALQPTATRPGLEILDSTAGPILSASSKMVPGRSLFSTLPAEIYDNIFEESFRIDGLVSLQCMRLVSIDYAYLPSLLRFLFQKITLPVSPESPADLSAIAPHVKHVSFEPTGYSWAMDLDTYRQILFLEPMRESCNEHNQNWSKETGGRYITTGDVSPLTFVKYYMGNKPPYTEEEVASRYNEYMSRANKLKDLFENGEFARHWTQMMRQMTGGITIETRHWRFGHDHKHGFTWVEGENAHTPEICMEIHGTAGETLFDTILKCATDAKVHIQSLNIYHCVRGRTRESFLWAFDGRLNDVDLQGLSFDPFRSRIVFHDRFRHDPEDRMLTEIITTLLGRIASKVRRLELFISQISHYEDHSGCTHWPPCIKYLVGRPLHESFISPAGIFRGGFRGFIREARDLKYLHLDVPLTNNAFNGESSWRRFWRAIRYHPSRMVLDIRCRLSRWPHQNHWLHLKHDTSNDSESEPSYIQYSLEMYLSNRGSWDTLCEQFFQRDEDRDYEEMEDTDDEEREYWEGKNDRRSWIR